MEKWIIFLLLLITTAGTFIPCCQRDNCCADQSINTKHENSKNEGTCPPFACATCFGFVELTNPIQSIQLLVQKQVHYEMFEVLNLSTFSATYWQPPRAC